MVGYAQYPHFNNDAIRHKDSVICLRIHNQEGAKDGKRSLRHLLIFILAKQSSGCISYKIKATVGFTQASHRGGSFSALRHHRTHESSAKCARN